MPDFADFARAHPEVEVEVSSVEEPVNLTNREADVAIRVVYDRDSLPLNLHGVKGPELFGAVYLSRDLLAAWRAGAVDRVRWIVKANIGLPDWAHAVDLPAADTPFRTTGADAQIVAVGQGLGMTPLSWFVGDADPLLTRAPGSTLRLHGTLWLLTQGETRKTKRVRLFTEFIAQRLSRYADPLAGRRPASDVQARPPVR